MASGPSPDRLFVYGSLRPDSGAPAAAELQRRATRLGSGLLPARLYRLSWYPGVQLDSSLREWVTGDIFRISHPATWAWLDEYEGYLPEQPAQSLFRRVSTAVRTDAGWRTVQVYVFPGSVSPDQRVASGDWLRP